MSGLDAAGVMAAEPFVPAGQIGQAAIGVWRAGTFAVRPCVAVAAHRLAGSVVDAEAHIGVGFASVQAADVEPDSVVVAAEVEQAVARLSGFAGSSYPASTG